MRGNSDIDVAVMVQSSDDSVENQFSMIVEELLDLVAHREIVGCVGTVRVHVTVPATAEVPQRGAGAHSCGQGQRASVIRASFVLTCAC